MASTERAGTSYGGGARWAAAHGSHAARAGGHRWGRWTVWAPAAAAAWSLLYGGLGLYWALGGAGFPFGAEHDPRAVFSILAGVTQQGAAPVIAVLGLIGTVVAGAMAWTHWTHCTHGRGQPGPLRAPALAFAWAAAVVLLVVVPDARALVAVAYAPVVVLGAPFGWPPGDYRTAVPWPVLNQFLCVAGGFAWAAAAVAYRRPARTASAADGAPAAEATWTSPSAAARWGRWAAALAVAVPLVYAVTRYAWSLGIPLGLRAEFLRGGQDEGTWGAGASLATVAVAGAGLTLGLVQRWGEVFPRWVPGLAGKRVPPALAVVPAAVVAILVTNAGLTFWRRTLLGTTVFSLTGGDWAALLPELLWPVWGAALGAATLAYYLRRRPLPSPSAGGAQARGQGAAPALE